ncbi:MAG: cytochrome c3 family protein [Phycisphaerales bacterium]|nr:cytochrome c3 family protein [Phycisphaerales bacterium]
MDGLLPPDIVMLADLQDLYEPVPFDHKVHAEMAEMSSGCAACHHYTADSLRHPACRSCHSAAGSNDDHAMPGLRGAYHRQCLGCHRQWGDESACGACHAAKPHRGASDLAPSQPSSADVVARMSPPAARMETVVYTTTYASSPVVTFHHDDHALAFGVRCAECHRTDSCNRCHADPSARAALAVAPAAERVKDSCTACHDGSNCAFCHDRAQRPRFDHEMRTGWSLEPHHTSVSCAQCHGIAEDFTVPSKTCHACHMNLRSPPGERGTVAAAWSGESRDECLCCHEAMAERLDHALFVHAPTGRGEGCTACHDVSRDVSPRPAADEERALCLSCHDTLITLGEGRSVANMASLLTTNSVQHEPVKSGRCSACHDPHASDHARLLVGEYAPGFYAAFDVSQYELCLRCHDANKLLRKSDATVTGFRNGDLNLHWLHVNRSKGRTCRACHETHASSQPFRMRETVPFGDSGWVLPVKYSRTATGGGCAPGCHAPRTYDRVQ